MLQNQTNNSIDNYRDRVSKFSTELDLGLAFYILKKSLIFVGLFFIICFGLAMVYLRYSQPKYQSSSVIQINDNNQATQILQINQAEAEVNKLAEAIEQMRSKIFLKRVIEKSDVQISYFNEGTFKSNELYKSSPYFVKFNIKNPKIYGTKIYIKFNNINSGSIQFNVAGKKSEILFTTNNLISNEFLDFSVTLNTSLEKRDVETQLKNESNSFFIIKDVNVATDELQSKITIKLLNDAAKTILITIQDINANKAKDLVNLVSEEYLIFDVERKSESSKSILSFIDEQLRLVYNDLKLSENNLENFRKENNYNKNDNMANANVMRLTSIEDEMLKVEMDEKLLEELQKNISKNKGIDTYQLISLIAGTEYESAIKEYTQNIQKILLEKENLLYEVTPTSENIKQINYNLEIQKKLLIETINAVRLKAKSKYANLLNKSTEFKNQVTNNPGDDVEHNRLSRLFSINEKYYSVFFSKKRV